MVNQQKSEGSAGEEAASGAAAAGGAPADAASRLDSRTHFNQTGYRGRFIRYGDSLAEVGFGYVSTSRRSTTARGCSENREENNERAIRRAKKRIRHLILSSGAAYLLTLTYRENVTDFDRASRDLTRFLRLVKREIADYVYIAIAERQKRGAWHWHLAVRGWQDVKLLRPLWVRVVGDGNIDVKRPPETAGDVRIGLARYLSKYLAKSFAEERHLNARRFRSSHGIQVPEERRFIPARTFADAQKFCEEWLRDAGGAVGYFVSCEKRYSGWGCSW